jgi:hypothetical protein
MEGDELGGLSREELLAMVRRQQEELAAREAAIERRDEKIRELEEELAQFRRPAKTPENSSVPPSRGQKANRAERRGRKPDPKRGHVGVSRVRSEPNVVVECRPRACDGCGEPLPETGGRQVGRSQVTELPSFEPVVIEGWQYAMTCVHCRVQTVGAYPVGLEPRRTFGPGIEALLSYLHERHHVGYERLVELCRDVFGLTISQGGVENALRRLIERARPTSAAIGEMVRGNPVINSDETSARVAGKTHWQWTFQTPEASYHVIAPSRGGEVIDAFLAGVEPEVWGSDLYAPQLLTSAAQHQICHSHQARDLTFASEADTGDERIWALDLRHVFGRAIRLPLRFIQTSAPVSVVTPMTVAALFVEDCWRLVGSLSSSWESCLSCAGDSVCCTVSMIGASSDATSIAWNIPTDVSILAGMLKRPTCSAYTGIRSKPLAFASPVACSRRSRYGASSSRRASRSLRMPSRARASLR